jgi:hypothetical protein
MAMVADEPVCREAPMRISLFLPLAAIVLLAGCNRTTPAAGGTTDTAAPPATTPAPAAGNDAGVTMRYACNGNTSVAILDGDKALVSLPDGPEVTLSKVADSKPPVFTGADLYFAIGDSGAHLSQGDETNELTCQPQ